MGSTGLGKLPGQNPLESVVDNGGSVGCQVDGKVVVAIGGVVVVVRGVVVVVLGVVVVVLGVVVVAS